MTDVSNGTPMIIQTAILLLAAASLGLSLWAARQGSPILALFGRWIRWLFLATLASGATYLYGWSGHSFPVLFAVALLGIFLIETTYNWIAISALSKSELPLFPRFNENEKGEEWPSSAPFLNLKDWLRKKGYLKRPALVSIIEENILMRLSAYENPEQTERLHVLFLPNPRGNTAVCLSFISETRSGSVLVTDNVFLPFGGFYPENWDLERRPWTRSPEQLMARHRARIDARAEPLTPFVTTPLEQINEDQRLVEQLNRDLGFLNTRVNEIEKGRLTTAGKARVWQEVWTLSYLGIPLRYS